MSGVCVLTVWRMLSCMVAEQFPVLRVRMEMRPSGGGEGLAWAWPFAVSLGVFWSVAVCLLSCAVSMVIWWSLLAGGGEMGMPVASLRSLGLELGIRLAGRFVGPAGLGTMRVAVLLRVAGPGWALVVRIEQCDWHLTSNTQPQNVANTLANRCWLVSQLRPALTHRLAPTGPSPEDSVAEPCPSLPSNDQKLGKTGAGSEAANCPGNAETRPVARLPVKGPHTPTTKVTLQSSLGSQCCDAIPNFVGPAVFGTMRVAVLV